jgi:uncharacterized protein (DUF1501 family)
MMKRFDRREFLKASAVGGVVAVGAGIPSPWMRALAEGSKGDDRILVVIQMSGGNDGLNTVVPYGDEAYRKARPQLGIAADQVLKINDQLGFHPSLRGVAKLLESGRFSIVQGVGYERPNRSHFESMDIWHTCQRKEGRVGEGWLGRWIASTGSGDSADSLGLHLGREQQPLAMVARGVQVPSIASVDQFRLKGTQGGDGGAADGSGAAVMPAAAASKTGGDPLLDFLESSTEVAVAASARLDAALRSAPVGVGGGGEFPATGLGEKLGVVSRLIRAGLSTRVYYVTLDGFDTHAQQPAAHAALLRQWSDAVAAFVESLGEAGQGERVLVMTFSEFGRRVAENASQGTDHGAAAPVFFCGPSLAQGVIGNLPSLTDLDDGDLKHAIDFRQLYATIIERWFGVPSQAILGAKYEPIGLLG